MYKLGLIQNNRFCDVPHIGGYKLDNNPGLAANVNARNIMKLKKPAETGFLYFLNPGF